MKPIGPPDLDLLRKLEKIEPEGVEADCKLFSSHNNSVLDGLIVAMDMINKHESTKKFQKRIFLVSDAGSTINNSELSVIMNHFTKMEAKLNIMYVLFIRFSSMIQWN